MLLLKMEHFRALEILKPYGKKIYNVSRFSQITIFRTISVDEKYHTLYRDEEANATKMSSMQFDTLEPAASATPIPIPFTDVCNFD